MEYEKIKNYWEDRAKDDSSPQSTTEDYYLRQLEIAKLKEAIFRYGSKIKIVGDFGCGDGFSTISLAKEFPSIHFIGYDYSQSMIRNAEKRKKEEGVSNVEFKVIDVLKERASQSFDMIYTDRVIINIPSWEEQKKAIDLIFESLNKGGVYVIIENFIDGHNNFNKLREEFGLDKIEMRWHNLFLDKNTLMPFLEKKSRIIMDENFTSTYFIVSRIVYTKICKLENKKPDYFDIHHKLGSMLPPSGNYGPTSIMIAEKK